MNLFRRIAALFRRSHLDRDMDLEMRSHLEHETEQNIARGMSPDEARCAARRSFGGVDQLKELERDARSFLWIEHLARDLRHAVRRLARSPGFTAVAVLSLALGIGANTAVFSLINALLLRALPVSNPHELRVIEWAGRNPRLSFFRGGPGGPGGSFPYPVFEDFAQRAAGSAEVFAFLDLSNLTVVAADGAHTTDGLMVSGNFFSGYGATPHIGRPITPEDDRPDAPPVAVVTHRWWERHAGGDPRMLGSAISINRHSFTIIGVLPHDFVGPTFGDTAEIYVPMAAQPRLSPGYPLASAKHWWVQIMARVGPGSNDASLRAAFEVGFLQALSAPGQQSRMDNPRIVIADGSRGPAGVRRHIALPLLGLLALVSVVLMVACANLASLLVARGVTRGHEMAVRAALGAARWRLIQHFLAEALVLAVAGGLIGLVIATWSQSSLLLPLLRVDDRFHLVLQTDGRVLAFTAGTAFVTALLAGVLPALRSTRVEPGRELGTAFQAGGPRQRLGRALVAVQMGLSAVLVVAAGLFGRSLGNLTTAEPGFRTENLLLFSLDAGQGGRTHQESLVLFGEVRERLAALPGVRSVTVSDHALLSRTRAANGISVPGREPPPGVHLQADQLVVGDRFFSTMEIPLLLGRELGERDNEAGPRVVVVNERFVRTFLGDVHPIGQVFTRSGSGPVEIVGVCSDFTYTDVRSAIQPTMILPLRQHPRGAVHFEVRSTADALSLVPAVREIVAALDRNIPLASVTTQDDLYHQSIFLDRLVSALCGAMALLAIGLTSIGLYGLSACHVARKTREIGVRIALGATRERIAREVLREGIVTACWGLAFGLPAALIVALLARAVFFGVPPYDPLTFGGAALLLPGVAVLAGWLPARRAARVDPMTALRAE